MKIYSMVLIVTLGLNVAFSQSDNTISESTDPQNRDMSSTTNENYSISKQENPHSKAIGERIAGFVLLGTAVLNFGLAVPMGQMMESTSGDGETWTVLIFTEGGIRAILGAVFIGIGYSKFYRYQQWEKKHGFYFDMAPTRISMKYEF